MHRRLKERYQLLTPSQIATLCGLFSAVGYSLTNSVLKEVAKCDPFLVSTIKAIPTCLLLGPWMVVLYRRGEQVFPSLPITLMLIGVGLLSQFGGNVAFQEGLRYVDLAIAIPVCLGVMILTSTILGWVVLKEATTVRMIVSSIVLLTAVVILKVGTTQQEEISTDQPSQKVSTKQEAQKNSPSDSTMKANGGLITTSSDHSKIGIGIYLIVFSGVSFSVLATAIRYGVRETVPHSTTLVILSIVGVISLGGTTIKRLGIEGILATAPIDLTFMTLAGLLNAISFLALSKALQHASVVYVNLLNASQVMMAVLIGIFYFHETLTLTLASGIGLTIVGLLIMRKKKVAPETG